MENQDQKPYSTLPLVYPSTLSLLPFQVDTCKQALAFMSNSQTHSCYIANEPGLGKTICSVVITNTLACSRTVVICPASMVLVWEQEILTWSRLHLNQVPKVFAITSSEDLTDTQSLNAASWVIISYGLFAKKEGYSYFVKQTWDMLISDENHYCKNPISKRTKAVMFRLWPLCTYHLCLSGTPFLNDISEVYTSFHAIAPSSFPSYQAFLDRYAVIEMQKFKVYPKARPPFLMEKPKVVGLKNAVELSTLARSTFYIRYKKEQVLKDLPPVTHQKIILPPSFAIKVTDHAQEIASERQLLLEAIETGKQPQQLPHLSSTRQAQGLAIISPVAEFATDLLEQNIPIIIFAHHKSVIDALTQALSTFDPVTLTGSSTLSDRKLAIENFQDGVTNLFIGNLQAAGTGITLTRATHVLLAEYSWVPAENSQAIARAHRIGTLGNVTAYWFIVRTSIHEQILEAVLRKTKDFKASLD